MDVRDGVRQGWYEAPGATSGRGAVRLRELFGITDAGKRPSFAFLDQRLS